MPFIQNNFVSSTSVNDSPINNVIGICDNKCLNFSEIKLNKGSCSSLLDSYNHDSLPELQTSRRHSFDDLRSECPVTHSSQQTDTTSNRISNFDLLGMPSLSSSIDQSCSIPTLCTVESVASYGRVISKPNVVGPSMGSSSSLTTKRGGLKRARWATSSGLSNLAKEDNGYLDYFSEGTSSFESNSHSPLPFSHELNSSLWGQFVDVNDTSECYRSPTSTRIRSVIESCEFSDSYQPCCVSEKRRRMFRDSSTILDEDLTNLDISSK
uniref:Uncharacterized protein n=1 Tax=Corethron hystrix TaxID=216773 RepID=A0A7S1BT07_9STRA|mmetsp:Transcript_37428/g.87287  ORF Transcript_37428/g.87287 Transcript_37428/m.87287 type:complete len:267 (+) Transcript_37428:134-934(+)